MNMLVDRNEFYALHQLAQYHALPDDLRLANRLLDLSSVYPAGKQLGIDMLLRLNNWPPICDLLIKEKKVEVALRLFVEKWDAKRDTGTLQRGTQLRRSSCRQLRIYMILSFSITSSRTFKI
eukprot:TRINITY_DN1223_c0_g2_i1.p1 TRINITY_DN1223_c0_g2~~TRINITY_DN1223_c0_g2_i1.p1  ORF type:complete len:122 (+),score=11.51 TRINITY_DN1223_c0_g2_i1:466-831(+)